MIGVIEAFASDRTGLGKIGDRVALQKDAVVAKEQLGRAAIVAQVVLDQVHKVVGPGDIDDCEMDHIALGGREIGDRVLADAQGQVGVAAAGVGVEPEHIGPRAPSQVIIPIPAIQRVMTGAAAYGVIALAAVKAVIPAATVQVVTAMTSEQGVGEGATFDVVGIPPAIETILADIAEKPVLAGRPVQGVVILATIKRIVTGAAVELVMPAAAEQQIPAAVSMQMVKVPAAVNRVVIRVTEKMIIPDAAGQDILPCAAVNGIVSIAARGPVITRSAEDQVLPVAAADRVIPVPTVNGVVLARCLNRIVAGMAIDQKVIPFPQIIDCVRIFGAIVGDHQGLVFSKFILTEPNSDLSDNKPGAKVIMQEWNWLKAASPGPGSLETISNLAPASTL